MAPVRVRQFLQPALEVDSRRVWGSQHELNRHNIVLLRLCPRPSVRVGDEGNLVKGQHLTVRNIDGEQAGTLEGIRRVGYDGTPLPVTEADLTEAQITTRDIDRGEFPHFLLKEISESPDSFRKTLRGKFATTDGRLRVVLYHRLGTLAEMAGIFAKGHANVITLEQTQLDDPFHTYEIDLEVQDLAHLTRILSALRASEAVAEADRI